MKYWRKLLAIFVVAPLLLFGLVAFAIFATVVIGHSVAQFRMQQRQIFWATELENISPRATHERVNALFQAHHITLNCDPKPAGISRCTGVDTKSYGFLPQWRINFAGTFQDGRLVQFKQELYGLGF